MVPLVDSEAHEAGRLLSIAKMADVVDAVVVTIALRHKAIRRPGPLIRGCEWLKTLANE